MIRVTNVKLPLEYENASLPAIAAKALRVPASEVVSAKLVKRSVDARDKGDIRFIATLDIMLRRESARLPENAKIIEEETVPPIAPDARRLSKRPVVVGFGPAGLFAALSLARRGQNPVVIERGQRVTERAQKVGAFWDGGALDPDSNVQFGEGGAGAFSDGKLNTGIKDARCAYVLQTLYAFGAPEEILYAARPHVGTDRLTKVVAGIREEILRLGGTVLFSHRLTGLRAEDGRICAVAVRDPEGRTIEIACNHVILAIGHSARDTFAMLGDLRVPMERKPFSIGARVEHRQRLIDVSQYGAFAGHPALGAAEYRLSEHLKNGRGVYTFCMCPGGSVIAAASETGGVATNGMSFHNRAGENANSAILADVRTDDFPPEAGVLAGVAFQRAWERAAFLAGGGNYRAPAQLVGDFLKNRASNGPGKVCPSYRPGVTWTNLAACLPGFCAESLRLGILAFDRKLHGFASPDAVLTGVETRSSSPVRILRGADCQSPLIGLYPAGEGAGYAGGILSAAVDGLRCAENIRNTEEEKWR